MVTHTNAVLDPSSYVDDAWFQRERSFVFRRNWHFAGFQSDLVEPGSFITARVGNESIIVWKTASGGLAAFRNVCSHRHARLTGQAKGCGVIRCIYHGWTYDDSGCPIAVTRASDNFQLSDRERQQLSLPRVSVDAIGPFVFVALETPRRTLRDELGEFAATIDSWSDVFERPFLDTRQQWSANWKTGVENTLEPYHAEFVHGESLKQVVEYECQYRVAGNHSSIFHRLRPRSSEWWSKMVSAAALKPCVTMPDYSHVFIYPNLCIGVTNGCLLSVQTFHADSPGTLTLEYRLSLAKAEPSSTRGPRIALERVLADFNETVLKEDRGPVESCQLGYPLAERRGILAASECRIAAFQTAIQADVLCCHADEQIKETP
jgi:choline monooxygenase